jgi:hypothetical protein
VNYTPETRTALEGSRTLLVACWRRGAEMLRNGEPLAEAVAAELLEQAADLFEGADRLQRLLGMTK